MKFGINLQKKIIGFLLMVIFVSFFIANNSYGVGNDGVRGASWSGKKGNLGSHPYNDNDSYHCTTSEIDFEESANWRRIEKFMLADD